jgi:prolyl 4-hydroxylase
MKVAVNIPPPIRSWIERNLDLGCVPEQLIEGLIAERFDPPIARGLIRAFADARATGMPLTSDTVRIDIPDSTHVNDAPRIASGHSIRIANRVVSVLARVSRPVIAVLANVLSAEECDELIAIARPRLKPSTVVDPVTGENRAVEYRSSEAMFFRPGETPFVAALEIRFSAIMNLPIEHGEGLQVLRYGPGDCYAPHVDFLVPGTEAADQSLRRSGQRVSSLVAYLNDVPGGGETTFPHAGLSVSPVRGNAVYFEYCNGRGQVDAASLHAGAPVIDGEKWVVTKWMRERRFVPAAMTSS